MASLSIPIFQLSAHQIRGVQQVMRPLVREWHPSLSIPDLDKEGQILAEAVRLVEREQHIQRAYFAEIESIHGMHCLGFVFQCEDAPPSAVNLIPYRCQEMSAFRFESILEGVSPNIIGLQRLVDDKVEVDTFLLAGALLCDLTLLQDSDFEYCRINKIDPSSDFYQTLFQVLEHRGQYDSIFDRRIEELGLPKRASNALKKASIGTIGQVINLTFEEARKIHGLGTESLNAILVRLSARGWTFGRRKVSENALLNQPFRIYWQEFNRRDKTWLKHFDELFIGDLVQLNPAEIRDQHGLHVLHEIERFLESKGLCLGMKLKDWRRPSAFPKSYRNSGSAD